MAASNPSAGTNRIRFSGLAGTVPFASQPDRTHASGTPLERSDINAADGVTASG